MVEASQRDGIHWASFCDEAAKRGLTDTRGLAPNPANARKTWAQARKVVQEGREAAKPPRPKPPSRFPKDWSPTVLREQEIPVPAYLRPAGGEVPPYLRPPTTQSALPPPARAQSVERVVEVATPVSQAEPGSDEYVREQLASIRERLGGNDWYLNPGVKKRP